MKEKYSYRELKLNYICSICSKKFEGHGNNSEPFAKGRCCDDCNWNVVIPYRIHLAKMRVEKC